MCCHCHGNSTIASDGFGKLLLALHQPSWRWRFIWGIRGTPTFNCTCSFQCQHRSNGIPKIAVSATKSPCDHFCLFFLAVVLLLSYEKVLSEFHVLYCKFRIGPLECQCNMRKLSSEEMRGQRRLTDTLYRQFWRRAASDRNWHERTGTFLCAALLQHLSKVHWASARLVFVLYILTSAATIDVQLDSAKRFTVKHFGTKRLFTGSLWWANPWNGFHHSCCEQSSYGGVVAMQWQHVFFKMAQSLNFFSWR